MDIIEEDVNTRVAGTVFREMDEVYPLPGIPQEKLMDMALCNEIGFDSLDQLELFMYLEKKFDVTISDEYFTKEITPNQIVGVIIGQIREASLSDENAVVRILSCIND